MFVCFVTESDVFVCHEYSTPKVETTKPAMRVRTVSRQILYTVGLFYPFTTEARFYVLNAMAFST